MSRQEWIIGLDLGPSYIQISEYDEEKSEPRVVKLDGEVRLPSPISAETADAETVRACIIDLLTPLIGDRKPDELMLAVTAKKSTPALREGAQEAAKALGLAPDHLYVLSHTMAAMAYAISQKKELWTHDVGLFTCERGELSYTHLVVDTMGRPASVTAYETDLPSLQVPEDLSGEAAEGLDQQFADQVAEVTKGRNISTLYLVGGLFELETASGSWMNRSLKKLCAYRRHVFAGQNLYSGGAVYAGYYDLHPDRRPDILLIDEDSLPVEVGILTLRRKKAVRSTLVRAGELWYQARGEALLLVDHLGHLILRVRTVPGGKERMIPLMLADLPQRRPKTVRLRLTVTFQGPRLLHVEAVDDGFGDFYPPEDKRWEMTVDLDSAETSSLKEEGFVTLSVPRARRYALKMPVTGRKVFTPEELCFYISENPDIISEAVFDAAFEDWLERLTGDAEAGAAFRKLRQQGRPVTEAIRLLSDTVDYFGSAQTQALCDRVRQQARMPALARAAAMADASLKCGQYGSALRQYHHITCHMMGDEAFTDAAGQAAVWHNMGIACLKLRNLKEAADCFERAWALAASEENRLSYIYTCLLSGDEEGLKAFAERTGTQESVLSQAREAVAAARSEVKEAVQNGLPIQDTDQYIAHMKEIYR